MPSRFSCEDGELAGGLGDREEVAAGLGQLAGAVGGHPVELLLVHLDEHAGGQQVALGQELAVSCRARSFAFMETT